MKRWHQEHDHMFHQWKIEMDKHLYDWRCPPTKDACHCARGIGYFRKRKPGDCGNPRCGICHWDKYDNHLAHSYGRHNKKRAAIEFELSLA